MIVLDTNVISEMSKPAPDGLVLEWFAHLPKWNTAITAVSVGEIWAGIAKDPDGVRKQHLIDDTQRILRTAFTGRVLPFDYACTTPYAIVRNQRRLAGLPISVPDAQIAAICRTRKAAVATRNIKDFVETGVDIINPWEQ